MLPAIHGGPSEDLSLCACFLLIHISQCISLSHCFSIHTTDSLFYLSFLWNLALGLKTQALERQFHKVCSHCCTAAFFRLHVMHSLEGFTEDTVKEQSEGMRQSILRIFLQQIPWYIPANRCLLFSTSLLLVNCV